MADSDDIGSEPESVASGSMQPPGEYQDLAAANRDLRRRRCNELEWQQERKAMRAQIDELMKRLPPLVPVEPREDDEAPAEPKDDGTKESKHESDGTRNVTIGMSWEYILRKEEGERPSLPKPNYDYHLDEPDPEKLSCKADLESWASTAMQQGALREPPFYPYSFADELKTHFKATGDAMLRAVTAELAKDTELDQQMPYLDSKTKLRNRDALILRRNAIYKKVFTQAVKDVQASCSSFDDRRTRYLDLQLVRQASVSTNNARCTPYAYAHLFKQKVRVRYPDDDIDKLSAARDIDLPDRFLDGLTDILKQKIMVCVIISTQFVLSGNDKDGETTSSGAAGRRELSLSEFVQLALICIEP